MRKINFDYLFLLVVLILINIRYFDSAIWPQHDTLGCFETFYFFYNDYFLHGTLPKWIPFGTFGASSLLWQVSNLTPASYFMFLIGKILSIRDVVFLFKTSVFIEQVMLLTGTYLLARKLLKHRGAVLFVTLCVAASSVWTAQIFLNFRMYYLLPFVFYLIADFFESKKLSALLCALIVYSISLMGTGSYMVILHIFIFVITAIVLFWSNPGFLKEGIAFNWKRTGVLLILFLILSAAYLYPFWDAAHHLVSYAPGRDAQKFGVSAEDFVTYGGHTDLAKYFGFLYPDSGTVKTLTKHPDQTLYMGLLPILFLIYGIWSVRRVWFWVFGLISLALFSFSLGDTSFIGRLAYHFSPMMGLYRHVGFVGGLLRFFLILTAGFGLDEYLTQIEKRDAISSGAFKPRIALLICGILVMGIFLVLDLGVNARGQLYPETWPEFFGYSMVLLGLAVAFLAGIPGNSLKVIQIGCLLFLLLDLMSYQNLLFKSTPKITDVNTVAVRTVNSYEFQPARTNRFLSSGSRQESALRISTHDQLRIAGSIYFSSYSFAQLDACSSRMFRTDFMSKPVEELLKARNAKLPLENISGSEIASELGCETPKLRLVSDPHSIHPENIGEIHPQSFSANQLRLTANVHATGGAWLVYLDSWYPDWKAEVNNREVKVEKADLAFKAVKLEQGQNQIRFWISSIQSTFSSMVLILSGLIFALTCLILSFMLLFTKSAHSTEKNH